MTANKQFIDQFYNTKQTKPTVVKIGGQFKFESLPGNVQVQIKDRLADKDPVIKELSEKKAIGVVIDGRQVTQDWANQLDLTKPEIKRDDGIDVAKLIRAKEKEMAKTETVATVAPNPAVTEEKPVEIKYTKQDLEAKEKLMGFAKFRDWAKKTFEATGTGKVGIIKAILKKQK